MTCALKVRRAIGHTCGRLHDWLDRVCSQLCAEIMRLAAKVCRPLDGFVLGEMCNYHTDCELRTAACSEQGRSKGYCIPKIENLGSCEEHRQCLSEICAETQKAGKVCRSIA